MGPGIPLVMAALGIIAFATSAGTKKAAASPGGSKAPVRPEFQDIPLPLLQEMAKAIQGLTVTDFTSSPDGSVTAATIAGPVTKESVQVATALAAKLEQAGFANAAKTIRDLANLAGKKIPSPDKDKQIPLPVQCFTDVEQTQFNRLVAVERDPKVLQGVLNVLKSKAVPAECRSQVDAAIGMLSALIVQVQAGIDEAEALRKTEEELKRREGQLPVPGPSPSPVPGPVNPVIPPQPPGPTPRVVIVKAGDGFARIAQRLIGDQSRWPELRNRNIPQDADGRRRAKDTDAKGGIKPILQPNQKLFVPENWPAIDSIPVNPVQPNVPIPVNPVIPPQPGGGTPKVYIVKSGDGFARIAQTLVGDQSRWPELRNRNIPQDADGRKRAVDTAAKGGIKPILQPNQKLFVPESWATSPGVPIGPVGPSPIPVVNPVSSTRVTVVKPGDGFARIAQRLIGDQSRWPELRNRNVPVDADGRNRAVDTAAKGGIKPILQPNHRLFVPENWPALQVAGAMVGKSEMTGVTFDTQESWTPPTPIEQKTPYEIAAEALVSHLNRLQAKHPGNFSKVRAKLDKRIVARFQKLCELPVDIKVTPAVLIKAAEHGQVELPLVVDWPEDATLDHVVAYRRVLLAIAQDAGKRSDERAVHELSESLKREKGQAAGLSAQ